jgi:hypothetical protein
VKRTLIASAAIVLCLTGCAAFNKEVAPRVAQAVNAYCLEPQESRALIRQQVNGLIAPNTIRVTCQGDAP